MDPSARRKKNGATGDVSVAVATRATLGDGLSFLAARIRLPWLVGRPSCATESSAVSFRGQCRRRGDQQPWNDPISSWSSPLGSTRLISTTIESRVLVIRFFFGLWGSCASSSPATDLAPANRPLVAPSRASIFWTCMIDGLPSIAH